MPSTPSPTNKRPLIIGTRSSPLALAQAHEVRARLMARFDLEQDMLQIKTITTTGDRITDRPLKDIGGKGLFTKEVEEELLAETIDIAVHSMKDMPTEQPNGLVLDTYLPREDVRDALISPSFKAIAELPEGAVIGTSSTRRKAQILNRRPDLTIVPFRGNVQTRLKKLDQNVASCTFLAQAGLNRLQLTEVPATSIDTSVMLPAPAQGAIGIERRMNDESIAALLSEIHDQKTALCLDAERSFLAGLGGSCETPVAALATHDTDGGILHAEILRPDGSESVIRTCSFTHDTAANVGEQLAQGLLKDVGSNFFT